MGEHPIKNQFGSLRIALQASWKPWKVFHVPQELQFRCREEMLFSSFAWPMLVPRTTVSQDVQTWFSVQLAFAKFLSKIKGNFWGSAVSMILALYLFKIPLYFRKEFSEGQLHRKSGLHVLWYSSPWLVHMAVFVLLCTCHMPNWFGVLFVVLS